MDSAETGHEISVLEGLLSVEAVLRSDSRPVEAVLIDEAKPIPDVGWLLRLAANRGARAERVPRNEIDAVASGERHGGIVAMVGPRRFVPLDELVPADRPAFVVMIDGVEDPYNFGQAVRSLYAAGADGLVLRPRNWMSAAGLVARASAGATERIPTAVAETAAAAADSLEQRGLVVACATAEEGGNLFEADLTVPLFLVIGGEQRGITRSFLRRAALRLRIPQARADAKPLGTAAASAVIAFEVMRQRATQL